MTRQEQSLAQIQYITSDEEAANVDLEISKQERISLDLEGDYVFIGLELLASNGRMYQYKMSNLSRVPSNLKELLEHPEITKIGTYMDYIVDHLRRVYDINIPTNSVFDVNKHPLASRNSQRLKAYRL